LKGFSQITDCSEREGDKNILSYSKKDLQRFSFTRKLAKKSGEVLLLSESKPGSMSNEMMHD